MRLKRFMSLVLACVFALSLVTVANAAGDVLYREDFSSYVDAGETTGVASFVSSMIVNNDVNWAENILQAPGKFYSPKGWINGETSAFVTNQAGNKAFEPHAGADAAAIQMVYPLAEGWDSRAAENLGKTLVFAYDLEYIDSVSAASKAAPIVSALYWSNADKSVVGEMIVNGVDKNSTAEGVAAGSRTLKFWHTYSGCASGGRGDLLTSQATTYRIAVGVTQNGETSYFKRFYGVNGSGKFDNDNGAGNKQTVTSNVNTFTGVETILRGFSIGGASARSDLNFRYADIMLYTIDTNSFAVSASKTSGLSGNETITFNFTNPVSKAAFDANKANITVKKGEDEFNGFEVGDLVTTVANGQISSSVAISFTGLEDSETYTVEFPAGITNEIAQPLNNSTVTLATVVPDLKVGSFTVISGWGTAGEAVVSDFTAAATLQGGKLQVVNNKAEDLDVAVIYAVYSHNGQLADMVYVQDVLKASGTSEIQAGVTLSESLTDGASKGKVKAFIWNTIDALKPYLGATERDIEVAAQ